LANIKVLKRLRGGDLQVAAQANVQIDVEIGQKDHFRIETKYIFGWRRAGSVDRFISPGPSGVCPAEPLKPRRGIFAIA